jgi:hypothetical protein
VVGPFVLAPSTVALLGLGIGLVLNSDAWDFGQLWVQLGLGLFGGAFLIGASYQSRTALAAERAALATSPPKQHASSDAGCGATA